MIHQPLHVAPQVEIERYQVQQMGWPGMWTTTTSAVTFIALIQVLLGNKHLYSCTTDSAFPSQSVNEINVYSVCKQNSSPMTDTPINEMSLYSLFVNCVFTVIHSKSSGHGTTRHRTNILFPWWLNTNYLHIGGCVYMSQGSLLSEGVVVVGASRDAVL